MQTWDDLEERFRRKVRVGGPDECWEWTAAKLSWGYGYWSLPKSRKQILAHRHVFGRLVGSIPKGLYVLHKCDNPPCVNPGHLFLGTADDNIRDSIAKGRYHGLKRNQMDMIREIYASLPTTQKYIGRLYGVVKSRVSQIILGK